MNMGNKFRSIGSRRGIVGVAMGIVLLLLVGNSVALTNNSTGKFIEKIVEIEIWAKTFINLEAKGGIIGAVLSLDNGTVIPEQELDFYLDDNFLESGFTDSDGYVEVFFGDYNLSGGSYSFKSTFEGDDVLFFNTSFAEERLEILSEDDSTMVRVINSGELEGDVVGDFLFVKTDSRDYVENETIEIFGEAFIDGEGRLEVWLGEEMFFVGNFSVIEGAYNYSLDVDFTEDGEYVVRVLFENLSNQTDFYFLSTMELLDLKDFVCEDFVDNVLFSSGYTQDEGGSISYDAWEIQTNCSEAGGKECSLHNINTISRLIYSNPYDREMVEEGYVQILALEKSDFEKPENSNYVEYLVRDIPKQEGVKWERYCEEDKTSDSECEFKGSYNQQKESMYYGIKTYAPQYSILDVIEIKYTWCWKEE